MQAAGQPDNVEKKKNVLDHGSNEAENKKAAEIIQRTYRGHRTRRQLEGLELDASTRWYEAIKDAQFRHLTTPTARQDESIASPESERARFASPARKNWYRATGVAKRAGLDDRTLSAGEASDDEVNDGQTESAGMDKEQRQKLAQKRAEATLRRKQNAKMMDIQYFLELVDHKHRYGSNLRKYHGHWKTLDTKQNFFYWLDQGDGRTVNLPECSRIRLDTEQVRYLSREERLHYLVQVDKEGRLIWAKNGERVWTKDELFKDSIKGIVPINDPTPKYKYNIPPPADTSSTSSSDDEADEDDHEADESLRNTGGDEGERYVNEDLHQAKGFEKIKHVSTGALFNHMIRTSMKKGHKWIFVADTSFRLYIGYKQSGAFQHSSFLHGSRITAAGVIKVKHGQLRSLAPLSGHYRPTAANFRLFVQSLRDEGVDMSRVSISKSYAVLMGTDSYTRTRNKIKDLEAKTRHETDKIFNPEKARLAEEARQDKSKSAERERAFLEQQRQQQREQQHHRRVRSNESAENNVKHRPSLTERVSYVLGRFKSQEHDPNTEAGSEGRGNPGIQPVYEPLTPEGKQ